MASMVRQAIRKCRCPSGDHGHKPGKCNNLATERDQLCKPCSDREGADLKAKAKAGEGQRSHSMVAPSLPSLMAWENSPYSKE
jgi:hypothetical protein